MHETWKYFTFFPQRQRISNSIIFQNIFYILIEPSNSFHELFYHCDQGLKCNMMLL